MKYVLCVVAVIAEFFAYAMIGAALGWRYGGGLLPQLLLYAAMAATCRAIIKHFNKEKNTSTDIENLEETGEQK